MGYETNAVRGVLNFYGPRLNKGTKFGSKVTGKGTVKEASWTFSFDDTPSASSSSIQLTIPEGSYIKGARLEVLEAFTGTGDEFLILAFQTEDGLDYANNLIAQPDIVALGAVGVIDATGAIVGEVLPVTSKLNSAAGGTGFVSGKARLVVEYVLPAP